jgi:uracil-DNA glycosylase family 4
LDLIAENVRRIRTREELLSLCECHRCPLLNVRAPVLGHGPLDAKLAIVGEAPGYNEAAIGKPFVGPSGKLLDATLEEVHYHRRDVYVTNAVLCRPISERGGDSAPPTEAIRACRPRLLAELAQTDAKVVVALGGSAAASLLQTREKVSELVGASQYVEGVRDGEDILVVPTYHPAAVLHGRGSERLFDDILDGLRRAVNLATGKIPYPPKDTAIEYYDAQTVEQVGECLANIAYRVAFAGGVIAQGDGHRRVRLALDTETDDVTYLNNSLIMVQVSDGESTWVMSAAGLLDERNRQDFVDLLESEDVVWVLHNMSFDFQFLRHNFGAVPKHAIDTMALGLGLTERLEGVSLKRLSRMYLNEPAYEAELRQYLPTRATPYSAIPWDVLAKYAARDARNTWRLVDVLTPLCTEEGTITLCNELLMPAQRCFADLEYRGVKIDLEWAKQLTALWRPRIELAEYALQAYAQEVGFKASKVIATRDDSLNPRSSKQLIHLAYDVLGMSPVGGKRTTDASFLEKYADEDVVKLLKDLRQIDHLYKAYVLGIVDDVWADGRAHPDFLLGGTVTGRLAIHNPPLQTIPKWQVDREVADMIHRLFIPSEGMTFVEVDYRQLELRVLWHLTGDKALGNALTSGDFHSQTASKVFRIPIEQVTGHHRFISKFVTFGIAYGRQAYSLATGELKCSVEEAQSYVDGFWRAYPTYYAWFREEQQRALRDGILTTPFGRKRRWNLITPENVEAIKNQAVNFAPQSTASDICLAALIRLNEILPRERLGYPLFSVHDMLAFEVPNDKVDEACAVICQEMLRKPFDTDMVLEVEVGVGPSWGDTKEWHGGSTK